MMKLIVAAVLLMLCVGVCYGQTYDPNIVFGVTVDGGSFQGVVSSKIEITRVSFELGPWKVQDAAIDGLVGIIGNGSTQNLFAGLKTPITPWLTSFGIRLSEPAANLFNKVSVGVAGWKEADSKYPTGGPFWMFEPLKIEW